MENEELMIGGVPSERTKELFNRLYTKAFDPATLQKELEEGKYDADTINLAAINYVRECCSLHLEFDEFWSCTKPGEAEKARESDHVTEAIKMLLPYGLDPNKVYEEQHKSYIAGQPDTILKYNIMVELGQMYDGYQAADSLYLLLKRGGDPFLECDGGTLIFSANYDLWDMMGFLDDMNEEAFDAFVHYWMVLISRVDYRLRDKLPVYAEHKFDLSSFCNHEHFYYGFVSSDNPRVGQEIYFFEKGTNLLCARFCFPWKDYYEVE